MSVPAENPRLTIPPEKCTNGQLASHLEWLGLRVRTVAEWGRDIHCDEYDAGIFAEAAKRLRG